VIDRLIRLADGLAALALAGLVAAVAGGVAGRVAADLTGGAVDLQIPGAVELARLALLILVFAALPRAFRTGLIRVDVLADRLPRSLARTLARVWSVLAAAFGGLLAWRYAAQAWAEAGRGDATQDLALPLWPFSAAGAVSAALVLLVALAALRDPGATGR